MALRDKLASILDMHFAKKDSLLFLDIFAKLGQIRCYVLCEISFSTTSILYVKIYI